MDHSAPFADHTHHQLTQKLGKFVQKESPLNIDVVAESTHGNQNYTVEIRLNSQHYHLIAHDRSNDLYKTLDKAVDILINEVRRYKEKMLDARDHTPDPFREPS